MSAEDLQRVLDRFGGDREIAGAVVAVESAVDGRTWSGAIGEAELSTPFFVASVTKLYTSALIMRLVERGLVDLGQPIVDLLPDCPPLHVSRAGDATGEITVAQLLAHTSGLPDYFLGKRNGMSLEKTIRKGNDRSWTFDDVIEMNATMSPRFPPGTPGKANYSDTNYQLLGRIIEEVLGCSWAAALQAEVAGPLGLEKTWLYADPTDARPLPLRDGRNQLDIPQAMTSFGPDGGIVADAGDLMRFLRAFFEGELFDRSIVERMQADYNRIMFPLEAGLGLLRFRLPRALAPFGPSVELVGHSGLSGAFAFVAPNHQLYLAGTVNNLAKPRRPYQLMIRLVHAWS